MPEVHNPVTSPSLQLRLHSKAADTLPQHLKSNSECHSASGHRGIGDEGAFDPQPAFQQFLCRRSCWIIPSRGKLGSNETFAFSRLQQFSVNFSLGVAFQQQQQKITSSTVKYSRQSTFQRSIKSWLKRWCCSFQISQIPICLRFQAAAPDTKYLVCKPALGLRGCQTCMQRYGRDANW